MIREALNWIKDHGEKQVQLIEKDGRQYTSSAIHPVKAPSPESLCLSTLSGLCEFINNNADKFNKQKLLIQIVSFDELHLWGPLTTLWRTREKFACVSLPEYDGFDFGRKMNHETFLIALQTHFEETEDLKKLLALAGTIKAGKVQTSSDDGISQTVESKLDVHLAAEKEVPNPVHLRPFRTFRDLDKQPLSKFVFRVHQKEDELPSLALYEADGGAWRLDAMSFIFNYLKIADIGVQIIV